MDLGARAPVLAKAERNKFSNQQQGEPTLLVLLFPQPRPACSLTDATEPELAIGSTPVSLATKEGGATPFPPEVGVKSPRAVPPLFLPGPVAAAPLLPWSPPAWSRSCESCCCLTPSASAGYGTEEAAPGRAGGQAGGRLRERPESDPSLSAPRPPSNSRSLCGTPRPCRCYATCWPPQPTLRSGPPPHPEISPCA